MSTVANLTVIGKELDIKKATLYRWAEETRNIGFPEPRARMGRYKLYDLEEVREWYKHWKIISAPLGNKELNGGTRTDG